MLATCLQHDAEVVARLVELRVEADGALVSVDRLRVLLQGFEDITQVVVGLGKLRVEPYRPQVHFRRFRHTPQVLIDEPQVVARRPQIRHPREHRRVTLRGLRKPARYLMLKRLRSERAELWC